MTTDKLEAAERELLRVFNDWEALRAALDEPAPDTAIERRPEMEIALELRHELFTDCIQATQLSVLGKSDEVQAIYDLAAKRIADLIRAERGTDD